MASDAERQQVSKDLLDYLAGTTTAAGAGDGSTVTDTALGNYDDDGFVRKYFTTILITSGTYDGEERYAASKSAGTVTMRANYTGQIAISVTYEVNHLFSAAEKEAAIDQVRSSRVDLIHDVDPQDITIVGNQMDYDLTAYGWHNNMPLQAYLVPPGDTESAIPYTDWYWHGTKIHVTGPLPPTGWKLRVVGLKAVASGSMSTAQLYVASALAGLELLEGGALGQPRRDADRLTVLADRLKVRVQERLANIPTPPAAWVDAEFQNAMIPDESQTKQPSRRDTEGA